MTKRSVKLYVEDILVSMEKIERYVAEKGFKQLTQDELLVDAVVRNLEIIGEASRNVPDEIRLQWPEIPWHRMAGLRNVIIHQYFDVDLEALWKVVSENLPETKLKIEEMLAKFIE
jgi:uncharacterized protein with HEPN domain